MVSKKMVDEVGRAVNNLNTRAAMQLKKRNREMHSSPFDKPVKVSENPDISDLAAQAEYSLRVLSELSKDRAIKVLVKPKPNHSHESEGKTSRVETEASIAKRKQALNEINDDSKFIELKKGFETAAKNFTDYLRVKVPSIISNIDFKIAGKRK